MFFHHRKRPVALNFEPTKENHRKSKVNPKQTPSKSTYRWSFWVFCRGSSPFVQTPPLDRLHPPRIPGGRAQRCKRGRLRRNLCSRVFHHPALSLHPHNKARLFSGFRWHLGLFDAWKKWAKHILLNGGEKMSDLPWQKIIKTTLNKSKVMIFFQRCRYPKNPIFSLPQKVAGGQSEDPKNRHLLKTDSNTPIF